MRSEPLRQPNDLFDDPRDAPAAVPSKLQLADGAYLLRGAAVDAAPEILAALERIVARAPFRQMTTPGGFTMSVAMTNCGDYGWITDRTGYRYSPVDPLSGNKWPVIPDVLLDCAAQTADAAGFPGYVPDACLINRYEPGTKLSLHQDKDERDLAFPVVSISLGIPAVFQFGGLRRNDPLQRIPLAHGDVVVWGGPSRLRYHAVLPVKAGNDPLTGRRRFNFTLRKAR